LRTVGAKRHRAMENVKYFGHIKLHDSLEKKIMEGYIPGKKG
jgi:hypothetical protein